MWPQTATTSVFFMFYLINLASTGSIGRCGYDRPRQNVETSLEVQLPHVLLAGRLVSPLVVLLVIVF